MAYKPSTPVGSGSGGSGKPKESASGGVQAGKTGSTGGGGSASGGGNVASNSQGKSSAQLQKEFEESVQKVQAATGSTGKQAAVVVRQLQSEGKVISATPETVSQIRSQRLQAQYEESVQKVQAATGLTSKESASLVRKLESEGKSITASPQVIAQLRAERLKTPPSVVATQAQQKTTLSPTEAMYASQNPLTNYAINRNVPLAQTNTQGFPIYPSSIIDINQPAPRRSGFTPDGMITAGRRPGIIERAAFAFTQTPIGQKVRAQVRKDVGADLPEGQYRTYMAFPSPGGVSTAGKAAKSTAQTIIKGITGKNVQEFGKGLAKGALYSELFVQGGAQVAKLTAPEAERKAFSAPGFRESIQAASQERDKAVSELPFYKELAAENLPTILYNPAGARYEQSLKEQFSQRGIRGEEAEAAVRAAIREGQFKSAGEVFGLLNVNRLSEGFGRFSSGLSFFREQGTRILQTKAGRAVAARVALPIFSAGVQEGLTGEFTQARARDRQLSAKSFAYAGLFGGASAAAIGVPIAGFAPNYPRASKLLEIGGYITDPYEYPGDVLQDVTEGVAARRGRTISPKPSLARTKTPGVLTISTTTEPGFRFSKIGTPSTTQTKGRSENPLDRFSRQMFGTRTPSPGRGPSADIFPGGRTPADTPADTPSDTPADTPSDTPADTPSDVPSYITTITETPTELQTNITTSVNLPADTPVGINSPYFRLPPPPLFSFPGGSGASGKGAAKTYLNELDAALGISRRVQRDQKAEAKAAKRTAPKKGGTVFEDVANFNSVFFGFSPRRGKK